MAKLKVPKFGYRLRLASGKKSKVHLARARPNSELDRRVIGDTGQTVCKFILEGVTQVRLKEVPASEICQKCLGAIECTD